MACLARLFLVTVTAVGPIAAASAAMPDAMAVTILWSEGLHRKQFYSLPAPATTTRYDTIAYSLDALTVKVAALPSMEPRRTFTPRVEEWMKLSPLRRLAFSMDGKKLLVVQHYLDTRVPRGAEQPRERARLYVLDAAAGGEGAEPAVVEWDATTRGAVSTGRGFVLGDEKGRIFRLEPGGERGDWSASVMAELGRKITSDIAPLDAGFLVVVSTDDHLGALTYVGTEGRAERVALPGAPYLRVVAGDGATAYILGSRDAGGATVLFSLRRHGREWQVAEVATMASSPSFGVASSLNLLPGGRPLIGLTGGGRPRQTRFVMVADTRRRGSEIVLPLTSVGESEAVPAAADRDELMCAVTSSGRGALDLVRITIPTADARSKAATTRSEPAHGGPDRARHP